MSARPRPRERGELVARGVALAAALAVSLLAVSGAGGAPAQTPKRGGTLVIGTRELRSRRVSTRSSPHAASASPCATSFARSFAGAFEVDPGRDVQAEPRLARDRHEEAVHAHVPHPCRRPAGATAFRSPRPDFVFTHRARDMVQLASRRSAPRPRPQRSRSGREDGQGRAADALPGLAISLRHRPAAARARGRRLREVWRDEIDNPKTGERDRQRSLPRRAAGSVARN